MVLRPSPEPCTALLYPLSSTEPWRLSCIHGLISHCNHTLKSFTLERHPRLCAGRISQNIKDVNLRPGTICQCNRLRKYIDFCNMLQQQTHTQDCMKCVGVFWSKSMVLYKLRKLKKSYHSSTWALKVKAPERSVKLQQP